MVTGVREPAPRRGWSSGLDSFLSVSRSSWTSCQIQSPAPEARPRKLHFHKSWGGSSAHLELRTAGSVVQGGRFLLFLLPAALMLT